MTLLFSHIGEVRMAVTHELETTINSELVDDTLLTVHDAARFLKVSVTWVYEHVRPDAGDRLPVMKLGKYLRFDRRDLQAYIDAKRAESRRQSHRR
jgi:excisionase family DNA binding protein